MTGHLLKLRNAESSTCSICRFEFDTSVTRLLRPCEQMDIEHSDLIKATLNRKFNFVEISRPRSTNFQESNRLEAI